MPKQLKLDRDLEVGAVRRLKGIGLCTGLGDSGSLELLESILVEK